MTKPKVLAKPTIRIPATFGFHPDDIYRMRAAPNSALHWLARGAGTLSDWQLVLNRLALGRELAMNFFDAPAAEELHSIIVDFGAFFIRFHEHGDWQFSENQRAVVAYGLNLVDEIQSKITRREFNLAQDNALSLVVGDFKQLLTPWEEYTALRAHLLRKHGRKVFIK
jgi:hypothetical protein